MNRNEIKMCVTLCATYFYCNVAKLNCRLNFDLHFLSSLHIDSNKIM